MPKPKKYHADDLSPAYEVGFGKPPKATQFQKGHSGNPKGRPKGTKNTATVARAVLAEKITIHENGRQKVVTKREAFVKKVINESLQGNVALTRLLITHVLPSVDAAPADGGQGREVGIDDALILGPLLDQLGRPGTLILEPDQKPANDGDGAADDNSSNSNHSNNSPPKEPI